jgi:hypothetical protein
MDEMLSLSELQDIVLPAVPPFWPPAPGFWILLLMLVAVVISGWRWRRILRMRNAYRQAGLELLEEARTVRDVSLVLKRVALAAWPRDQVASLYDSQWADFLNNSCAQCQFEPDGWRQADEMADPQLIRTASHWIRQHRLPARKEPRGE